MTETLMSPRLLLPFVLHPTEKCGENTSAMSALTGRSGQHLDSSVSFTSTSSPTPSSRSSSLDAPLPPKPTRSEYAAYTAMLRDLEARDEGDLARYLIRSDRLARSSTSETDIASHSTKRKSRIDGLSTHWPLSLDELREPTATLGEAIMSFVSSYTRSHRLSLPRRTLSTTQDEDLTLPPSMVDRTRELINATLVRMAGMRPVAVAEKRKGMRQMGWEAVISAASWTRDDQE